MLRPIFQLSLLFSILASSLNAQVTLVSEDFNNCTFPPNWGLNIIGPGAPVYYVGTPQNPNADGTTIDGTCMFIIDDDAAGDNTPGYTVQLLSPAFDGTQYPTINLDIDVHWRPYQGSTLKIKVFDGTEYHEVRSWGDGQGTGEDFSEFEHVTLDLSFYASANMQVAIEYNDNDIYAWWAGVDNIEVTGLGTGTNVVLEDFNDCMVANGWTTQAEQGNDVWQFGLINNGNASANSMNGSCMAYFDDDGLGQNAAFSSALLYSPPFSGSDFANYTLDFDLIFRKYADLEQVAVWVSDGINLQLVQTFDENVAGPQYDNFEHITIDISLYRSTTMQIVFSYFDGNDWGWWTGVDNVKVRGEGQINDLCSNAFDLITGSDCLSGNNLTAIFQGDQPTCNEDNIAGLWYRYIADFSGILKLTTEANFNDLITVFTGGCDAPTEMQCTNRDEFGFTGETIYMDVISGMEYLFRVSGVEQDFGVARGNLCISAEQVPAYPPPPSNDVCGNAVALNIGGDCLVGQNVDATFEGPSPIRNVKSKADIWYRFVATTAEEMEIKTNANFADVITLFGGTCGSLTELESNELGQVLKFSGLTVDETYYIQVAGYFATVEGEICIEIDEVAATMIPNDLCANATSLTIGGGCVTGENTAANFDGPDPSCAIYSDADIWYQFVAPASGGIQLNTGADFVHSVGIYSGDCTNLTEYTCLSNPIRCEGYVSVGGLTAGETYFMQIASGGNSDLLNEGEICIELIDLNAVPAYEPLSLTVTINCIAEGFGQLQIEAVGGLGAYTFEGNTNQEIIETGGEYIVLVKDENDCELSRIGVVDCGTVPCVLNTSLSFIDVSCHGAGNGQAFIEVLDGAAPFEFNWSSGQTTALVNSLDAGQYNVTVTDASGCPTALGFEISEPDFMEVNISATGETSEAMNDGTASAAPSGGTEPYTYEWNTGSTDQSLNGLSPGIYTVTIMDENGCQNIESVVVSGFECALSLDIIPTEISCTNANNGVLEVAPQNGVEPYTYEWSTGGITNTISGLGQGTYTVTVIDGNGCPWIENVSLIEPMELSVEATAIGSATCFGAATGSVTVQGMGGTMPYSYTWSNGNAGPIQPNMFAGNYAVTITDDRGCTDLQTIQISQPAELNPMSINPQDVSCFGANDGIGTVLVNGGTAPYSFQWNDPQNHTSAQADDLPPGTYTVDIEDVNGCTSSTTVSINEPPALGLTVDAISNETDNQGNGMVQVTVTGGEPPYDFSWTSNGDVYSESEDPMDLPSGTYVVVVTDDNDCTISLETIVIDNIVGISDPELAQLIDLLPNPTEGDFHINIELENVETVRIVVTDVLGRVLVETVPQEVQSKVFDFDLREYADGVYPVKVFVGEKVVLKRVVVQ